MFRRVFIIVFMMLALWIGVGAGQEEHEHAGGKSREAVPAQARIDINRASPDELMKVPGMTRTWALRIAKYRPYRTKLDLLEQGIVPGDVYRRIRDYVVAHKTNSAE